MAPDALRPLVILLLLTLLIGGAHAASLTTASDYYSYGNELVSQGKSEEALQAFQTAASLDQGTLDKDVGLSYQIGWVLNRLGRSQEAYDAFVKAEQNHPDWISSYSIYYNEGYLLAKMGKNEEANDKFDEALSIDSTSREAWFNKGLVLARLGRYSESADALEKSRKAYGSYLPLLGSYQEAADTYDLAKGIVHTEPAPEPAVTRSVTVTVQPTPTYNPAITIDLQMKKGEDYAARYMYEEAVQAYDQVLANEPSNYRAMEAKAVSLANLGRFDDALALLDKAALYLDSKSDTVTYVDTWYVKGWVLANLGRFDDALDAFNKALAIEPDAYPAYYNKAWVLAKTGDTNGAVAAYDHSLAWDNPQQLVIKSYAILGPVGTYSEAADAIDKTVTERLIYRQDFSTDPHWQTSNPRNYYWDSAQQSYYFMGDDTQGFAEVPVPLNGTSFLLEYDITIPRAEPGSAVHTGLSSHNATYSTTDAVYGEFKSWKAGIYKDVKDGDKTFQVIAVNNGNVRTDDAKDYSCLVNPEEPKTNATFGETRIYHVIISYDQTAGQVATKVTDNIHGTTYANCAGVYNNLGTIPGLNRIVLAGVGAPNQEIEGYIDNVRLYATGLSVASSSSSTRTDRSSVESILGTNQSSGQGTPSPDGNFLVAGVAGGIVFILIILGVWYFRYYIPTQKQKKDESELRYSEQAGSAVPGSHHDLFISYSSKDKPVADAICAHLEASGVRCWIAPRDILPGRDFPESIIQAIDGSRIMVLVFSSNSNASRHVMRELNKAINNGIVIVPFRIEDVPLSKSMEYLIGVPHWLNAMNPPLEEHIGILVTTVKKLLDQPPETS